MTTTGLVHHPRCLAHDAGPDIPETPARLQAILTRLEESGLGAELDARPATLLDDRHLLRVHDAEYLAHVREACARGPGMLDNWDVVVGTASEEAARYAAGGLVDAVGRVMAGEWSDAFVAVRPPGHHAERREAMGFCLYNSVAVAARCLQAEHGVARVAIVDFDVHHGNGTQHAFEKDPTVFYASLHQFPHYPGTGAANECGKGAGAGATLNCPLAAGTGDREWITAMETQVLPALEDFDPGFLLLSAGFDAHELDPLSATRVTEEGYRRLSELLVGFARAHCRGRVVSLLEGGYHLDALARSVETHVGVLRRSDGA